MDNPTSNPFQASNPNNQWGIDAALRRDAVIADLRRQLAEYAERHADLQRQVEEHTRHCGTWQPVPHGADIALADGSVGVSDERPEYYLFVVGDDAELNRHGVAVRLPPDLRLCQRAVEVETWLPVGAADPDIVCEHGTLVQAHGTSIAIGQQVTPDSDELVWTVAELPAGYALCTRQEPPA